MVKIMKNPIINIKNSDLNQNNIVNFEPSDEELKKIEAEINNLMNEEI